MDIMSHWVAPCCIWDAVVAAGSTESVTGNNKHGVGSVDPLLVMLQSASSSQEWSSLIPPSSLCPRAGTRLWATTLPQVRTCSYSPYWPAGQRVLLPGTTIGMSFACLQY